MRSRLKEFSLNANSSVYDIIIITETWLFDEISNEELQLSNYNIYRTDRDLKRTMKSRGGGVMVAVNKSLNSSEVYLGTSVESVYVKVNTGDLNLIVGGVYIPPASDLNTYNTHCSELETIYSQFSDFSFIIAGDYNLAHLVWENNKVNLDLLGNSKDYYDVINATYSFLNLLQVNEIPNNRNVFLDLIFTNITDIKVCAAIDSILPETYHHIPYHWSVYSSYDFKNVTSEYVIFDFANGNYHLLNEFIASVDWKFLFDGLEFEVMVSTFYNILFTGIEKYIPKKTIKYCSSSFPKWFNKELIDLCRDKKVAHSTYIKSGKYADYLHFKALRSRCKDLSARLYNLYLVNVNNSITDNPKYFWKFVNDRKKSRGIPNEMSLFHTFANGGENISNLFAKFFSSVYVIDDNSNSDFNFSLDGEVCDSGLNVNLAEIFEYISQLKSSCNPGPDGVPSILLKNCVFSISLPLFLLFKTSLSLGNFPTIWKNSYVTPIFKSGNRNKIDNYRGVCNQSVIPKILDFIVAKQLQWISSSLISVKQNGFYKNRSTLTNLMEYYCYLNDAFSRKSQIDSLYADFSKAFDKVNHRLLIFKMTKLGFSGKTIKWLTSFLFNRSQQVKIGNHLSSQYFAFSGVPQGSHCGPILFQIFVNDLTIGFQHSKFLLYADDLKLFRTIQSVDDASDFQLDLNTLHKWTVSNLLPLNLKKCCIISFFNVKSVLYFDYQLGKSSVIRVNEVKDLGIILDSKLTFKEHFHYIFNKSISMLGLIWRHCRTLSVSALKTLYFSLVQSNLQYCSPVWSPFYRKDIDLLERVQKKFLRLLEFKLNRVHQRGDYTWIMCNLKILSLEDQRKMYDVCFLHGLVNGYIDNPSLLRQLTFLIPPSNSRKTRSTVIFRVPVSTTNKSQNHPIKRMMETANRMADNSTFLLFDCDRSKFKSRIKCILGL